VSQCISCDAKCDCFSDNFLYKLNDLFKDVQHRKQVLTKHSVTYRVNLNSALELFIFHYSFKGYPRDFLHNKKMQFI